MVLNPESVRASCRATLAASTGTQWRRLVSGSLVLGAVVLVGCNSGSGTTGGVGPTTAHPQLVKVQYGRLVDVYGFQQSGAGQTLALYRKDIIVGPDIQDERDNRSLKRDDEVLYDFISSDPDTLQPRLFIPRAIGSSDFLLAFEALDDQLRDVTAMTFGQGGPGRPYSVVPRNAAIRLWFSSSLGISEDFFVVRDAQGVITGIRNAEAVQLLQIAGDPTGPNAATAFRPLPMRIVVRDNEMLLDPVLMGSEGLQYQTRNNAGGLPGAPDQLGANIRIALAMEGPLAIPGLRSTSFTGGLTGMNNSGQNSIVRDFRSGNVNDNSSDISRGFVRDPIPPRLIGAIPMFLERVDTVNELVQEITVYKHGIIHEVDRGDVFRFVADNSGVPMGTSEVVADPVDDRGTPAVQHVRVRIRFTPGLAEIDPRRLPGYPADQQQREAWLVLNAPRAILAAEFAAGGTASGDDPRYFITFSPTALPDAQGNPSPPGQNISPFAGAVIRFTKPVDLDTVKRADTFFFGTRNLLDPDAITSFIADRPNGTATPGMDPSAFKEAKYRTPHLVGARVFDEDGSQTTMRLQPTLGFYLDDAMRNPPPNVDYRYWLHLLSGADGVRDLSGNPVDFQADSVERANFIAIPFSVDTRSSGQRPFYDNNLAVYVVRRHVDPDEDPQPSYYLPGEVNPPQGVAPLPRAEAQANNDLFGAFVYAAGVLQSRPTTRVRKIADNLNQAPVADQGSNLRWCPEPALGEPQIASNTSTTPFGQGIQNPHNPFGCRLQTVWREIDLSLSRVDPYDFNLDVEQMYWAPFIGANIAFDEFDRVSLFLGHCEFRPEPCVGNFSALPTFPESGLEPRFQDNYVRNVRLLSTTFESQPSPHPAYVDAALTIDSSRAVLEPNRVNRFLPLPTFRNPYFVYRDETVVEQGGVIKSGSDLDGASFAPYILSPFLNGQGRRVVYEPPSTTPPPGWPGGLRVRDAFWNTGINYNLTNTSTPDRSTDGLCATIALPLLADFWTYCDQASLPAGNGYVATGYNGWQISLTVTSAPNPYFRAYSAGRPAIGGSPAICRGPGDTQWENASGGYTPAGGVTPNTRDNSLYWIMIDFLKRASVVTGGFLDVYNPHRVPTTGFLDTRLGPYFLTGPTPAPPQDVLPAFSYDFDPPLGAQPGGTSVVVQFRGAGPVDADPWYWRRWYQGPPLGVTGLAAVLQPTATNFPLDPQKAGDAHIRKFDDRPVSGAGARNYWTYFYTKNLTGYVQDPNTLVSPSYLLQYAGPNDQFTPRTLRYVNWRYLMSNNTGANPPVSPSIDTFSFNYRFERTR